MKTRFGRNSVAAKRLLDDLEHLPPGAIAALAAAGGGTVGTADDDPDVAARATLRACLRDISEVGGRLDAVRAIGSEIEAWASSTTHWFPAGVAGSGESTAEIGPRMAAVPVVLDAAYAVILEDLLDASELDLLMGPWDEVVGSPFGDERDERERGDTAEWLPGDAPDDAEGDSA